ncbi:MAG: glycosyltransferase [Candidatus Marinimicrobia bacterium]|nr:glycosyltransferase [Candidatus Neomarinimicrobiota bacterium]
MITGLLVLSTLIYTIYTLVITRGLLSIPSSSPRADHPTVAIVIAARNEEQNLPQLLSDLVAQNYLGPLDIYIADDRSTDSTWSILEQFSRKHNNLHPVRVSALAQHMTPKKNALTECLKQTTAELILTTDADCRVGPAWVASAVSQLGEDVGILIGYSQVEANTFFQRYQALDFVGIMAANAGMMTQGRVWSGSGQNLAYRRSAFTAIGGFNPVAHKISGDDVYLVQTIPAKTGLQARFNFDPDHFVRTMPMNSLKEFINQRIRWSSNSRGLEKSKPWFFAFLVSAFLTNLLLLISVVSGWFIFAFWFALVLKFLA